MNDKSFLQNNEAQLRAFENQISIKSFSKRKFLVGILLVGYVSFIFCSFMSKIELQRKYDLIPSLTDWLLIISGILLGIIHHHILSPNMRPIVSKSLPFRKLRDHETETERLDLVMEWLEDVTLFSISSIGFFYVCSINDILPKIVGGNFSIRQISEEWPKSVSFSIKLAHALNYGYYIERTFTNLMFEQQTKTFFEYFIHHILSLSLCLFSFHTKLSKFALIVLFIIYTSGIPMNLRRLAKEFGHSNLSNFFYCVALVNWIVFRFVCLMGELIWPIFTYSFISHPFTDSFREIHLLFLLFLLGLYVLFSFWFYFILCNLKSLISSKFQQSFSAELIQE